MKGRGRYEVVIPTMDIEFKNHSGRQGTNRIGYQSIQRRTRLPVGFSSEVSSELGIESSDAIDYLARVQFLTRTMQLMHPRSIFHWS
jgi:hypothetical protein